jgi:hypothetical protein
MSDKQTATSASYESTKSYTKDYQKSNYDNQTDNKENNSNMDMSMGLGEGENNKKTKTTDQRKDEPTLPKETVTKAATTSLPLQPAQSEVFDSSGDNAMSEMKQIADMEPDEASKVFSHVEEKQQLDPLTTVDDNTIKGAIPANNPTTNPANSTEKTLQEIDRSVLESKEEGSVLTKDVKPDVPQYHKELEQQDRSGESVRFNDELNKEYHSTSLTNNDENNNPFISGIKLWQAYNEIWINTYNKYMKTWRSMFKTVR